MKRKQKTQKIAPGKHSRMVVQRMRARMITDLGCHAEHDVRRNASGDIEAFTDWRAVVKARLVDADYALVLDIDALPEAGRLDGLCVSAFEGLATGLEHATGDVYACFAGGRIVPFICEKVTKITDPAELTARELQLARTKTPERDAALVEQIKRATAKTLTPQQLAARRGGGRGRRLFGTDDERFIVATFGRMNPHRSKNWRYRETVRLAAEKGITRKDGGRITTPNIRSIVARHGTIKRKN